MGSRVFGLLAALTSLIALAGCGLLPSAAPPAQAIPSPTDSPATRNPSGACPVAPRTTQTATDSPLKLQATSPRDSFGAKNLALNGETLAKHPEALREGQQGGGLDADAGFDDGAFVFEGLRIRVTARAAADNAVTIMNVRLVNIVEECMPLDLLYAAGTQGEPGDQPVELHLDADADRPLAFDGNLPYNQPADPYFNRRVITVEPGHEQQLSIHVTTVRRPYSFDIAFDVAVGDRRSVQILRNGKSPFRIAPGLCPTPDTRAAIDPQDLAWFDKQHFKKVIAFGQAADKQFGMYDLDPAKYSPPCNRL